MEVGTLQDVLNCRQVSSTWKTYVDTRLKNMETNGYRISPLIAREVKSDPYFADFFQPALPKDRKCVKCEITGQLDECDVFMHDGGLHYRDFILYNMTLHSPAALV